MAETLTPHFSWIKPDIGGDASTWGNVLNTTFDAIDSVVWANQQGSVQIGAITMFAGAVLPANWLWCNGAVYLDSDIPALAVVLARKFPGSDPTHNAVPNFNARFAVGSDFSAWPLGLTGGEQNHTLAISELPVHSHSGSQAAHTHPGTYQDVHDHYVYQDVHAHSVYDQTHIHVITTGNHGHTISTGGHSHSVLEWSSSGGGQNVRGDLPSYFQHNISSTTGSVGDLAGSANTQGSLGGNADSRYTNISATDTRQPWVYADTRTPLIHVDTQTPVVTVGNTGSGAAANNMPPYTAVGFIIRYR